MMKGGVAVVDITPAAGLLMSGFAARITPASGSHDSLSVRAISLNDTALIVCDVIGMHEDMSARIRRKASLPDENIVITALHNHGAPASMAGRLGEPCSQAFLDTLEQACIDAIDQALENARPCTLSAGNGTDPCIAKNRREDNGEVDNSLPVLQLMDENGKPFAVLVSYACHPVVLGADNPLYTADYPHFVRQHLENQMPGCTAVFALGAAGDINSGHSSTSSISLAPQANRTFAEARRIGVHIAQCALQAQTRDIGEGAYVVNEFTSLDFLRRESADNHQLLKQWSAQMHHADSAQANLLRYWINWAEQNPTIPEYPWPARVSVIHWGRIPLIALPGEQFATVAIRLRTLLKGLSDEQQDIFVLAYAEGNPGYICPDEALQTGGYEPDEAHRYYGLPASFAPGSVSRLLAAVKRAISDPRRFHQS